VLIPDAPELIANFLEQEQDASCKRNAFMMLIHADQDRALNYLSSCIDQVQGFGDILQLVIVELIYKVMLSLKHHRQSKRTLNSKELSIQKNSQFNGEYSDETSSQLTQRVLLLPCLYNSLQLNSTVFHLSDSGRHICPTLCLLL